MQHNSNATYHIATQHNATYHIATQCYAMYHIATQHQRDVPYCNTTPTRTTILQHNAMHHTATQRNKAKQTQNKKNKPKWNGMNKMRQNIVYYIKWVRHSLFNMVSSAFWLAKYDVYCVNISPYEAEKSRQPFLSADETEAKILPANKNVN